MSGTGRSGRPASVSDLVDGAAVPGARKLASPRRASIIWLTRSVRSPLAITQQITARTARARNTATRAPISSYATRSNPTPALREIPLYVIPEGAGPCQVEGLRVFVRFPDGYTACRAGPRASPGAWAFPVSRLLPIRVSGPCGSRTGRGPASAAGVLDAEGRDPIIGRRGTGGCVVVVAAGPRTAPARDGFPSSMIVCLRAPKMTPNDIRSPGQRRVREAKGRGGGA